MGEETKCDKVMEIYNHIGEQERHFNELEKSYRLLASQWLLASLGVIGYLLQSDKIMLFDKNLLIGLIGLVSNFGIFLLWIIDIKVYHKLLNCAFLQGIKLEQENDWLPKIRTDMLLTQEKGDVINQTGLYYLCTCILLQLISIISIGYFLDSIIALVPVLIIGAGIIAIQARYMHKKAVNPRAEKIYRLLEDKYIDEVTETISQSKIPPLSHQ
jgi:hypothetical protein